MSRKVTVFGDARALTDLREHAVVVTWPSADAGGAVVVVVAAGDRVAEAADFIARRAPAAVVIATDPAWCAELLEGTQFPRGRVLGAAEPAAVVDAVLGDARTEHEVVVRHDGEHGRDGFHAVRATVGAAGALAI